MKKILIIICLLFLSGCSATYEITLDNNKIKEKLTLIETNQSLFDVRNDTGWTLREIFNELVDNQDDEFSENNYLIKSLNNNNQLGVEYKSSDTDTLINSSIINQCYINPVVKIEENIVTFNTGTDFKCYDYYENLDTIKIVLKTNNKVISSNADEIEKNKYIWNITNESNKQIEISYEVKENNSNNVGIILIIIPIMIISFLIFIYIKSKTKGENKI